MRVFFSVGEPSGDLHGANLVRSLQDRGYQCEGYGGAKMAEAGCRLHEDLTQYAVMFFNALKFIPKLWKLYKQAEAEFASGRFDAVVLIDFPGFNWWIAKAAKRHNVPVYYYGVPQMWAWLPGRVKKLKRLVDHVLCKLPFEQPWFTKRGCQATYVGHPYFDELSQRKLDQDFLLDFQDENPLLTILPGSRNQEVKNNLQWLVEAALLVQQRFPKVAIAIAAYNYRQAEFIRDFLEGTDLPIDVYVKRTPELIESATICLACSGSVSLELMYHKKPSIIVYRLKPWQAMFKRFFLRCRFITLVNLLAVDRIELNPGEEYDASQPDQEIPFPEFPWLASPVQQVAKLASAWLEDPEELQRRVEQLQDLKNRYGQSGATQRAAEYIDRTLGGSEMTQPQNSLPQSSQVQNTQRQDSLPNDLENESSQPTAAPNLSIHFADLEDDWSEADWAPAAAAAQRRAQFLQGQGSSIEDDQRRKPFDSQQPQHDANREDRRAA